MKFGVCRGIADFEAIRLAGECGADYVEPAFRDFVTADDETINNYTEALKEAGIPCLTACNFIKGDLALCGDSVDYGEISDYLDRGFATAKKVGLKKVVFGSGAARSCPDGFSPDKAYEQVVTFLSDYAAPKAKNAGVIITIEPLSFSESTMIHTVFDGVKLAKDSGADNVFGLADLYHVYRNKDDIDGIASFKGKLCHAHIANGQNRYYPLPTDDAEIIDTYKRFLSAVIKTGCDTCSIEARTDDFASDFPKTLKFLRELTK